MIESDSNAVAGDYLERLAQETDVRSARRALLASDIDAQGLEALHGFTTLKTVAIRHG